jgi:hypothetical protein
MLWAFIPAEESLSQRGRHDLQRLYEAGLGRKLYAQYQGKFRGGLVDTLKSRTFERRDEEISRYLTDARIRWANSYRYYYDCVKNKLTYSKEFVIEMFEAVVDERRTCSD